MEEQQEQPGQGLEDQYVFSCCAAERFGALCLLFSVMVQDDGTRFAMISNWPVPVPVNEVATYSRKKSGNPPGDPAAMVLEWLKKSTDERRVAFFNALHEEFCPHCGSDSGLGGCCCMRDD